MSEIPPVDVVFDLKDKGHFEKGVWVKPLVEQVYEMGVKIAMSSPVTIKAQKILPTFEKGVFTGETRVPTWTKTVSVNEIVAMSPEEFFEFFAVEKALP